MSDNLREQPDIQAGDVVLILKRDGGLQLITPAYDMDEEPPFNAQLGAGICALLTHETDLRDEMMNRLYARLAQARQSSEHLKH